MLAPRSPLVAGRTDSPVWVIRRSAAELDEASDVAPERVRLGSLVAGASDVGVATDGVPRPVARPSPPASREAAGRSWKEARRSAGGSWTWAVIGASGPDMRLDMGLDMGLEAADGTAEEEVGEADAFIDEEPTALDEPAGLETDVLAGLGGALGVRAGSGSARPGPSPLRAGAEVEAALRGADLGAEWVLGPGRAGGGAGAGGVAVAVRRRTAVTALTLLRSLEVSIGPAADTSSRRRTRATSPRNPPTMPPGV